MPGGIRAAFSEPEDFGVALHAEGCLSVRITGRDQFRVQLTQIRLGYLRLSASEESLPRIAFTAVPADMVMLLFQVSSGPSPIYGGIGIQADEIMTLGPGTQVHSRSGRVSHWGAIWLPVRELIQYGAALTGAPFVVPLAIQTWRPPRAAGRHLRSLHAAAIRMADIRPRALLGTDAVHALEQQLIEAVVDCLSEGSADTGSAPARQNQDIMARFERLLQTQSDRDMRMTETCATLGVSQRLLRALCSEHLGMGPTTYDRLRRMSLACRVLRLGGFELGSVSEVARRHGFRDPGRFALSYKAAFGELPTETLRRGSDR